MRLGPRSAWFRLRSQLQLYLILDIGAEVTNKQIGARLG